MKSMLTVEEIRKMLDDVGATMRYTPADLRGMAHHAVIAAALRLGYSAQVPEKHEARAFVARFVELAEAVRTFEDANLALARHREATSKPDGEDARLNEARVAALKNVRRLLAAAESS
jgi:hypothetical protein